MRVRLATVVCLLVVPALASAEAAEGEAKAHGDAATHGEAAGADAHGADDAAVELSHGI